MDRYSFDGTLNTIGLGSIWHGGEILPEQRNPGHGFAGAEGYTYHRPARRLRYDE